MRMILWFGLLIGFMAACSSDPVRTRAVEPRQPAPIPSLEQLAERFVPEACEIQMWEDGDTPTVLCGSERRKDVVRMIGIDTAESGFDDNSRRRGQYQVELWGMTIEQVFACGKAATHWVRKMCPVGSPVEAVGGERGKYGRRLAYVVCRGVNLNLELVAQGLAGRYPYPGPPEKPSACPLP